jgi:hypothetical protein
MRTTTLKPGRGISAAIGVLLMMTGCAGPSITVPSMNEASLVPATATGSSTVPLSGDLPVLREGVITPDTYVILPPEDGWGPKCIDGLDCPAPRPHDRSMQLEITIPSGWESAFDSTVIVPASGTTEGPNGSGLVIGWNPVGLHSDPCHPVQGHFTPDILPGPSVDDLVSAVVAHPTLEVREPVDVQIDRYSGQFFKLIVPSDITDCGDWRPFEPGIYAQGPDNIWNVWVIDVDRLRMLLLVQEFQQTPEQDSAELRAMVESIRFVPSP